MIRANRKRWFEVIMRQITHRQLRRQFHSISWKGENPYPSPAIYIANHSSWWDGLLYFHLRHTVIDRVVYILMHEEGLKKFWYFQWIGAYSVNKTSRRDIVEALSYSKQLLEEGKSIWIFPQGDEYHQEKRPLKLETGVGHLASQLPDVPIIPLSFYYTYGHHQKGEVVIRGGAPLYYHELKGKTRKEKTEALQYLLQQQLEDVRHDVIHEELAEYIKI